MGSEVVLAAFVWALVADGTTPTLTVHGSNDPAFFTDLAVGITRTASGTRSLQTHTLGFGANLLWQLHFPTWGGLWTPESVVANLATYTADMYLTRLGGGARYTQLFLDGSTAVTPYLGFDIPDAHVWPISTNVADPPAYRYYALTVSIGLLSGSVGRVLELQEWQPLIRAPAPVIPTTSSVVYGRPILPATDALYRIRLTKPLPVANASFGYMELWDGFRVRAPYRFGGAWSSGSFSTATNVGSANRRRATVYLADVTVPRSTLVRPLNAPILIVPFLWCFVRHPAIFPSEDQAAVVHQILDPNRLIAPELRPPNWISHRDTMRFFLATPNAHVPCGCPFINLPSSGSVQVQIMGNVVTSLPEFCFVLPSGDMVDIVMYEDNCALPVEGGHDETAGINVLLTVQFEEPALKRVRNNA